MSKKTILKNRKENWKEYTLHKIASFCDQCGTQYTLNDVQIIQDTKLSTIIHLSCSNCKTENIINIVHSLGFINRTPIYTDLTPEELSKYIHFMPVQNEDLLLMSNFLKQNDKTLHL